MQAGSGKLLQFLPALCRLQQCAWNALHCGNWKEVHPGWRHLYSLFTRLRVCIQLSSLSKDCSIPERSLLSIFQALDVACMLGHALDAEVAQSLVEALPPPEAPCSCSCTLNAHCTCSHWPLPIGLLGGSISPVAVLHSPTALEFQSRCLAAGAPAVVRGSMGHWPAFQQGKWHSLRFWHALLGHRTVPVEEGASYMAEGWSQRLQPTSAVLGQMCATDACPHAKPRTPLKYLAQHCLVQQVPSLQSAAPIPDLALLHHLQPPAAKRARADSDNSVKPHRGAPEVRVGEHWWHPRTVSGYGDTEVLQQIWLGPAGTTSNLHFDEPHNLLAQVAGCKTVLLLPPTASSALTSCGGAAWNTATLAPYSRPQEPEHGSGARVSGLSCTYVHLQPGEMLYIPPGWWHHVRAETASISVSFWWGGGRG